MSTWTRTSSLPAKHIVMIDVPDPDNALMALWVMTNFPDELIAVVLSVRPVSFKAAAYGHAFERLVDTVSFRNMIVPLSAAAYTEAERTWIKKLSPQDRSWFYVNPDLSDSDVRDDTSLYMQLSAFRMSAFWQAHGISSSRYRIYWDEASLADGKILVGMAHAFHVHDWSFDFDANEMNLYREALESISDEEGNILHPLSDTYRTKNRIACATYIARKAEERGSSESFAILQDFRELMTANTDVGVTPHLYVGGPFCDALTYIRSAPVADILAMGGSLTPGSTLFPNQFNFHVALDAANAFLDHVAAHTVPLTLLPTECVKDTVFALSRAELVGVFGNSRSSMNLLERYYGTANSPDTKYLLYDLVAVLTVKHPDLYPKMRFKKRIPDEQVLDRREAGIIEFSEDAAGAIEMYVPDEEHMLSAKDEYLAALKATVR